MARILINLDKMIAQKVIATGKPVTLKEVSEGTGISENRLVSFRKQRASAVKLDSLVALCLYFDCQPGDLLVLERQD